MTEWSDYIPHAAVTALAVVASWIGKDHFERDNLRFKYIADAVRDTGNKLDKAIEKQSENHAEILKLLIQPVRDRKIE